MKRSIEISSKANIIVFTDLDGSLLDHDNYDHMEAASAIERLHTLDIPIIPTTSKTIAEIKALPIDFKDRVMIGENGMVIEIDGVPSIPGHSYEHIRAIINDLPKDLREHLNGFADMSIDDIARHTGLPPEKAKRAKERDASEPFLWSGDDIQLTRLKKELEQQKLFMTQGGRFYHIMSKGGKATALKLVCEKMGGDLSIALGDGPNDANMLGAASYGIQIPNPHGKAFTVKNPEGTIIQAPHTGPKGWNAAMHSLLDELGLKR